MKGVDTIARIRREFFVRGKTIKHISPKLHIARNTVRKVLRSGATEFHYEREHQPRVVAAPVERDQLHEGHREPDPAGVDERRTERRQQQARREDRVEPPLAARAQTPGGHPPDPMRADGRPRPTTGGCGVRRE